MAALDLELDATSMLVDRMFGRMVTAEANDHGRRWFTRGCALLDHHHQLIKLKQDHAGERGEAGAAVEAPSWTEVLDLRARGLSFHSIATSDGLDDPYDANVLVTHHLDAFLCAAVTRLRAQQVADLERQWVRVWPDVIVGSMPNPTALAGATQILRARARVRGLYVAKPVVEPEHGFEPRRWGDPNRRRCCGTTRRVS